MNWTVVTAHFSRMPISSFMTPNLRTRSMKPGRAGGHSPVEYVAEIGQMAKVKNLVFTHHDPSRTDDQLDQIVEAVKNGLRKTGSSMQVLAAADGQVIELQAAKPLSGKHGRSNPAIPAAAPAMQNSSILMGISNARMAMLISEAGAVEGVQTLHAPDGASTLQMANAAPPQLVILEDRLPGIDGLTVCKNLRSQRDKRLAEVPIVLVGDRERVHQGAEAGVSEWLVTPFSTQFARAHIHAWLMRSACRWVRAALPPDEDVRLAALRDLSILDTPPEERFDRITRVAAALANVPIALVSLIDEERQWFKSCIGLDVNETSRELAFCAHVVASREPMIVPDTHLDVRFADSPLVIGGPRIRFYAGFPIFHKNGSCMGTLCLIDTRPRTFPQTTIQMFADLANVVQEELNSSPRSASVSS